MLTITRGLGVTKVTGLDGIPARFLKNGADQLASNISHIINLSITFAEIPKDLKMARVVPSYFFKKVVKLMSVIIDQCQC